MSSNSSEGCQKDICITNINPNSSIEEILKYFSQFGPILRHHMSKNRLLFVTFESTENVDECLANRPHQFDDRTLYVKRSLPFDPEHPRERFEATEELMIVINFEPSRTFLDELTKFFSSYGKIEYVGYEFAETFRFVLLKFTDRDSVDQIILDKPHFYNDVQLDVMKYIENNIELTSAKFANSTSNDKIFQREKFVKELHDDFERKRQSLEEDSKEQCDALEESTKKTRRLHDELQKNYQRLLNEFEAIRNENQKLTDEYLMLELENFELTSLNEQILK